MKPVAHIPVNHPWVCVDLDGTLMEDNCYPGFGSPRLGAKDAVDRLHVLGYKVMIFTARTGILGLDGRYQDVNRVVDNIKDWCWTHGIKQDYVVPLPKPTHVVAFFDDRAVTVVNPPDPNRDHAHFWADAMKEFERRYGPVTEDWRREVTPKTFDVEQHGQE